jgi:DNA-binding MarR family transcriptional regulator
MPDGAKTRPARPPRRRGLDVGWLEDSIGYNLRRADVYLREQYRRMLGAWHVRPAEYSILRLIQNNPSATQADLGDVLYIKRQNMGSLVKRLERQGWVRRGTDPGDGRRQLLLLTPSGSGRLAELAKAEARMNREMTRGWSDAERGALLRLLQRLYRN